MAAVSSLQPEHALRRAASALASAFQAVTQGPVEDALLVLPEVSRRSPLASWKALVQAIAAYHRREDAKCRKWLEVISADSLPARLVPCLTAMTGAANGARFSAAEQKLLTATGAHAAALRSAVEALEEAFQNKKQARILEAIRTAVASSYRIDKQTRERLRKHIAVRAGMQHLNHTAVHKALDGIPRWDAYYFRLLARSLEDQRTAESSAEAAIVWEDFRREALREKWFSADSLEDGVLSLHLAQLIEKLPSDAVEAFREEEAFNGNAGKRGRVEVLPSPGRLYARGCKSDPSSEAFQLWLNWAGKSGSWQAADQVAEAWRKARPKDIQPSLYLMDSTEKRSAYKKSLKHLQEAEELDRLNPAVRRAKLRLLLIAAIRHLQQDKTHLAKAEIEKIESVPEVRPGEVIALAAALRWCCAALDTDSAARQDQEEKLQQSIGGLAAFLLLSALAKARSGDARTTPPLLQISHAPAGELLTGTVKACVLGQWAGLRILLPRNWSHPLLAAQKLPSCPLDLGQMLALGEAAVDSGLMELAYAVSTTGLASGRANARFLFLRAQCLPSFASQRQDGCCLATLELARRERDNELAGKLLDRLRAHQRGGSVSPELLSRILEEEQGLKEFPVHQRYREPKYAEDVRSCAQVDGSVPWEDEEEEDQEDDFGQADFEPRPRFLQKLMKKFEGLLGELPPELAEQVMRDIAAGEDPIAAMGKAISAGLLTPVDSSHKERAAKAPLPGQGSLF